MRNADLKSFASFDDVVILESEFQKSRNKNSDGSIWSRQDVAERDTRLLSSNKDLQCEVAFGHGRKLRVSVSGCPDTGE